MAHAQVEQHSTTAINLLTTSTAFVVKFVDDFVATFEKKYPSSKGAIPKTVGDRLVLLLYLYIFVSFGLKIVRFFVCGIFCCGLCSKRKTKAAPKPKEEAKKAAKPKM